MKVRLAIWKWVPVSLLMMAALACNLPIGVPRATPTLAPTRTPSRTPSITVTSTNTAAPTATATSTASVTATPTDTSTPTDTVTPSLTSTASATSTPTQSPTASATSTATSTPTVTPSASHTPTATATQSVTPSATNTASPTSSPTLTDTPQPSVTATFTPTRRPTSTATASPTLTHTTTATMEPSPTLTRTYTPRPTNTLRPTSTATSSPSATPTVTRTPRPIAVNPSATSTATFRPTLTPTSTTTASPTATPLVITVQSFEFPTQSLPVITQVSDLGILPTSTALRPTSTLAPTITPASLPTVSGGLPPVTSIAVLPTAPIEIISEGGQRIAQRGAFAVDPNSLGLAPASNVSPSTVFLDWSAAGQIAAVGAEDVQYPGFGFELKVGADLLVGSPLPSASIRFLKVRWSPNGQQVAFQAETPGARGDGGGRIGDTPSDGLWVWTLVPGQESQSTHHALMNRYAYHYGAEEALMVNDFAWSPDGTRLLVELARDGDRAGQVAVIHPGWNAGDRPTTRPYEYGSWPLRDSSRMLVSGRGPEGVPVLAWVNADLSAEETLLDARTMAQPLWMQNAVHVGGSQFAFVGALYSPGDPQFGRQSDDFGLYVYTVGSQPRLVARFGGGPVIDAQWNDARTAVLAKLADARVVVASIYGTQIDYSARVGGGYVGWRE